MNTASLILAVLAGYLAGKLINYLSDVLPLRRRLVRPFCRRCEEPFPGRAGLLNYALWPRRCPNCRASAGLRPWLVELASSAAMVYLWQRLPNPLDLGLSWLLLLFFGVVTVIDLEHRLILHPVSLAGMALGLVIGARLHGLWPALLGGLAGMGIMLGLFLLGILFGALLSRLTGANFPAGEVLGFGDVMLSAVNGLLLGWPGVVLGILLTILLSGAVSLVVLLAALLLRRYRPGLAVPYGPFLVASAVFLLFR